MMGVRQKKLFFSSYFDIHKIILLRYLDISVEDVTAFKKHVKKLKNLGLVLEYDRL